MIKFDLSFYVQKLIIYFYSVIAGGIVARAFSSARNAILLPCQGLLPCSRTVDLKSYIYNEIGQPYVWFVCAVRIRIYSLLQKPGRKKSKTKMSITNTNIKKMQ